MILPLKMDVLPCATLNVGKPSYKDKASNELFEVGFTSKQKFVARQTFFKKN